MKTSTLATAVVLFALASQVQANSIIAYTSFEEPTTAGFNYTDTLDPATDHELINNPGEPPVQYTSVGGELGFRSFYTNTLNSTGVADGWFVGVNDAPQQSLMPGPTDGTQRFWLADTDGLMTVVLDSVDLSATTDNELSMEVQFRSSSWEWNSNAQDYFRAWVEVDDGNGVTEYVIEDTQGESITFLGYGNTSQTFSTLLPSSGIATLKFEAQSQDNNDWIAVDVVTFTGTAIPEPSSLAILSLGCIVCLRRQRC